MSNQIKAVICLSFVFGGFLAGYSQTFPEFGEVLSQVNHLHLLDKENSARGNKSIKLDSIIVSGRYKLVFEYNSDNKLVRETFNEWNSNQANFDINSIKEYDYHPNGELSRVISYQRAFPGSGWQIVSDEEWLFDSLNKLIVSKTLTYKSVHHYDSMGYLDTLISYQKPASSSIYKLNSRMLFTNNSSGSPIMSEYQLWNSVSEKWIPQDLFIRTYNTAGGKTSEVRQYWDSIQVSWLNWVLTENQFDSNNVVIESVNKLWSLSRGWVNYKKYEYINNGFGKRIQGIYYECNIPDSIWLIKEKYTYEFDGLNRFVKGEAFTWVGSGWQKSNQEDVSYSPIGNIYQRQLHQGNNSVWSAIYKSDFESNEAILMSDIALPISRSSVTNSHIDFELMPQATMQLHKKDYSWNFTTQNWDSTDYTEYFYSSVNTSVRETDKNLIAFKVFPNPVGRQLSFMTNETANNAFVKIYDTNGRLLIKENTLLNEPFELDNRVSNGIYLIVLVFENGSRYSTRVVVSQP